MSSMGPADTLGGLLAAWRHDLFVGRAAELDLFRAALGAEEPAFRMLFLVGPGGVGKTTLLDAYAAIVDEAVTCVVRIDGRDVVGTPAGVTEALAGTVDIAPGDAAIRLPYGERLVLLVDGWERLSAVESWLRERLLPRLPASTIVVVASREPPGPEWRADPAWSELLRIVSLRNLEQADVRRYLDRRGVRADRHADVLSLTYGHPLALSLLADRLRRDPDADLTTLPMDVVAGLLRWLVADVPSVAHQRALEVSAVARTTSEGLLRAVVADTGDPHLVFQWLAGLSVTELRTGGLVPHDLVRDVLDADLRRRDPDGYREVFRAVRADTLARIRGSEGRAQQHAIADLKFLFRNLRSVLAPVEWQTWGNEYPDRARPADHQAIEDLVRTGEGDDSAALVRRWLDRQPDGFHVIRGMDGTVRGVLALLDLTVVTPADRDADPGTAAAWRFAQSTAPVRAGESVGHCRFIVDSEVYQGPSATLNAVPVLTLQRQLATPHLAWDFVTLAEPDRWNDYFAAADMPRAVGADFVVGGRRYGLFGHDFRRVPVELMTERWTERALADDALLQPAAVPEPELLVLARGDFADAVKQALRDLHRPDLLRRNPLLRTRCVAGHEDADGLGKLLHTAVATLADDPRDDQLYRALQTTYVRASRTQEAAAAALGLPFSTYRRHLRQGHDRVVAWLWRRELGLSEHR
ncbi:AAA family ATPase [Kribbella sp. NPDC050470]|uniref:AAA family ATPase n=2 Tax=unclassified Kribbella TaxID=2644121 RepID=UPI0037AEF235